MPFRCLDCDAQLEGGPEVAEKHRALCGGRVVDENSTPGMVNGWFRTYEGAFGPEGRPALVRAALDALESRVERLARARVTEEREACAEVADRYAQIVHFQGGDTVGERIAKGIRARGEEAGRCDG